MPDAQEERTVVGRSESLPGDDALHRKELFEVYAIADHGDPPRVGSEFTSELRELIGDGDDAMRPADDKPQRCASRPESRHHQLRTTKGDDKRRTKDHPEEGR